MTEAELKIMVCPAGHVEGAFCQCRPLDGIQRWKEIGADVIIIEQPVWVFNGEIDDYEVEGRGGIDKAVITSKYGGIIGAMLIRAIRETACEYRNYLEKHFMCSHSAWLPGLLTDGFEDRIMAKLGIKCKVVICSPC